MSANSDQDQKAKFIFPNVFQIQTKKQKSTETETPVTKTGLSKSQRVLKAEDIRGEQKGSVQIKPYNPLEMAGKRVARPEYLPPSSSLVKSNEGLEGLKKNLKTLNDLQARLRFMLKELEDLTMGEE